MKKYKMTEKMMNYFLNENSFKWFSEKIAHYPFCKKTSIKFRNVGIKNGIKGLRLAFELYPELEQSYQNGEQISIDFNIGYLISKPKEQAK